MAIIESHLADTELLSIVVMTGAGNLGSFPRISRVILTSVRRSDLSCTPPPLTNFLSTVYTDLWSLNRNTPSFWITYHHSSHQRDYCVNSWFNILTYMVYNRQMVWCFTSKKKDFKSMTRNWKAPDYRQNEAWLQRTRQSHHQYLLSASPADLVLVHCSRYLATWGFV